MYSFRTAIFGMVPEMLQNFGIEARKVECYLSSQFIIWNIVHSAKLKQLNIFYVKCFENSVISASRIQ
jgi:hypothetical protein